MPGSLGALGLTYGYQCPKKGTGEGFSQGHTNCMLGTGTLCQEGFNFPRRDQEGPHLPGPLSVLPSCLWWMLCPLFFGTFGPSVLFSAVSWMWFGSSSVCHLELAMAWHHSLPCARVLAQPLHRLEPCFIFWGLCHHQKGDLVPLMGGADPTPAPAGSHSFLGASIRTFTEASV